MRRAMLPATTLAAVAAAVLAASAPAQPTARAAACTTGPVDVEAIIDDSGSMYVTDPDKLRVKGVDLLIEAGLAQDRLGAIEFGGSFDASTSVADSLFTPAFLDGQATRQQLEQKIAAKVNADDGSTDYNAAFDLAATEFTARPNPRAVSAAIFLTDGGHNVGSYLGGHTKMGVPVYVISFGGSILGSDEQRLKDIASETKGKYFPLGDSTTKLQSTFNQIQQQLHCSVLTKQFSDSLAKNKTVSHAVRIPRNTQSATFTATFDPQASVSLSVSQGRRKLATVSKKKRRKPRVTKKRGTGFRSITISHPPRGRLRVRIRATNVPAGGRVSVTTDVTRRK